MGSFCRYLDLCGTVTVSFGRLTLLATVTGGLLLSAPCAADSTVWFTAGPAAVTLRLPARWTADTVDYLLLALLAVLSTLAVLDEAFANLTLGHYWVLMVGTADSDMISAVSGLLAKEVLGKARHYAHYHVTNLEDIFNKPCTVLITTNNGHFFCKIIYSKLLIKWCYDTTRTDTTRTGHNPDRHNPDRI